MNPLTRLWLAASGVDGKTDPSVEDRVAILEGKMNVMLAMTTGILVIVVARFLGF